MVTIKEICAGSANTFTLTRTADGNVTVSAVTAGSNGSTSGTTFALGTYTQTATNIYNDIAGDSTTSAILTATNPSAGVIGLTAKATGLVGNGYTLSDTATRGVTLVQLSGGTSGTTSGTTFSTSTDSTTQSTNLANEAAALASAINTTFVAVTATSTGATVTVTDKTAGAGGNSVTLTAELDVQLGGRHPRRGQQRGPGGGGGYPAKYSFLTTSANCDSTATPDFVAYNTGLAGSATQASIIAYDNLYSGCSGAGSR